MTRTQRGRERRKGQHDIMPVVAVVVDVDVDFEVLMLMLLMRLLE
jgi:hypothetical protein